MKCTIKQGAYRKLVGGKFLPSSQSRGSSRGRSGNGLILWMGEQMRNNLPAGRGQPKNLVGYLFCSPFIFFILVMWIYRFYGDYYFKSGTYYHPDRPGFGSIISGVLKDPLLWLMVETPSILWLFLLRLPPLLPRVLLTD